MQAASKRTISAEVRSKLYRLDARMNQSQKLVIQQAADLEGRTFSDFVLRSAESAAIRAIQKRTTVVLNACESEAFVKSLLAPAPAGRVLRKAVHRYKRYLDPK